MPRFEGGRTLLNRLREEFTAFLERIAAIIRGSDQKPADKSVCLAERYMWMMEVFECQLKLVDLVKHPKHETNQWRIGFQENLDELTKLRHNYPNDANLQVTHKEAYGDYLLFLGNLTLARICLQEGWQRTSEEKLSEGIKILSETTTKLFHYFQHADEGSPAEEAALNQAS